MIFINKSIWLKDVNISSSREINKDLTSDVLVIGGGITGLSCCYFLKGKEVVLVDKGLIGFGVSSYSTGKLTYLQDSLVKGNSKKEDIYLNSQIEALNIIKDIINKENIKCKMEENSSFLFATNEKEIKTIKKIEKLLKRNNVIYTLENNKDIPDNIYSIKVNDTYVFNSFMYLKGLKEILKDKVEIYENSLASKIDFKDGYYYTKVNNNIIRSKIVIVATHYPFLISLGLIPFKTYVEKSYLLASESSDNKKFNAISASGDYSVRYYSDDKNYEIYCSLSKSIDKMRNSSVLQDEFILEYQEKYNKRPIYKWSNIDIMSPDSIPLSGKLHDNLYIGTCYSTWGFLNGTISAKIISDSILKIKNPYSKIFSPKRMRNIFIYTKNSFTNGKSLILNKLVKNHTFYKDNVSIYKEDGVWYGKYVDEKEKSHIVYNTCPHMKCNLVFNYIDKTWDCPCHSSKFDIDGNLIHGPSAEDIKLKKK